MSEDRELTFLERGDIRQFYVRIHRFCSGCNKQIKQEEHDGPEGLRAGKTWDTGDSLHELRRNRAGEVTESLREDAAYPVGQVRTTATDGAGASGLPNLLQRGTGLPSLAERCPPCAALWAEDEAMLDEMAEAERRYKDSDAWERDIEEHER